MQYQRNDISEVNNTHVTTRTHIFFLKRKDISDTHTRRIHLNADIFPKRLPALSRVRWPLPHRCQLASTIPMPSLGLTMLGKPLNPGNNTTPNIQLAFADSWRMDGVRGHRNSEPILLPKRSGSSRWREISRRAHQGVLWLRDRCVNAGFWNVTKCYRIRHVWVLKCFRRNIQLVLFHTMWPSQGFTPGPLWWPMIVRERS